MHAAGRFDCRWGASMMVEIELLALLYASGDHKWQGVLSIE